MRWLKKGWFPLAYTLLALVMTYPLPFRLGSHYVGVGGDLLIFRWNDWWCQKCLLEGRNPLYTTWLFHPQGVSLVYHNFAWLNTAMWLPLSPLIGPVAAHNVIFLFNLALGGIGMHYLVHYLTRDHRAAFVAGLIFAFWPCRMSHYNHPNMISVGWIPLFLLFLIRTIREESKLGPALLGALFLALTGLARWLHLMFAGGIAVVYVMYSLLLEGRHWNRNTVAALALTLGLAVVLMGPLLSPLVVAQVHSDDRSEDVFSTDPDLYSTDLVSYFVPERGHPFFMALLSPLWSRMRRGAYVGYSALALAVVGALRGRRDRACWLVVGAGLFVLSLGPRLQVAGRVLDIRLPYAWVQDWAPVRVVRHPNRFSVPLSLPLAVLAGYGMSWLLSRLRRPIVLTVGLGALLLVEYLPWPYPTVRLSVPPLYHQLAQEPDEFAVLDLPLGTRTVAKPYMYYATVHGKPLVEGHVSRLPPAAHNFIDSSPLLRGLHQSNEMDPGLCDISRQLATLDEVDIRYLILHPELVSSEQLTQWRSWLAIEPVFEDQYTVVYRTRPQHGRDFEFVGEVGDGIGVISAALSTSALAQDGWLEVDVVWGAEDAPKHDWLARLALVSPPGMKGSEAAPPSLEGSEAAPPSLEGSEAAPLGPETQWVDFEPCGGWATSEWGADAVARGRGLLHVDPFLEGGTYTVTVTLVEPNADTRAGEPVSIGQVELQTVRRQFERPEVDVPAGAFFGDKLRLLGYGMKQSTRELDITLHWQALRRMEVAYKFFVHVFDPETRELVAQVDFIPRDWTYPTHWWEEGEFVSDEITLAISDVPPGEYQVVMGVYDPDTGARLPVAEAAGVGAAKDHYVLLKRLVLP